MRTVNYGYREGDGVINGRGGWKEEREDRVKGLLGKREEEDGMMIDGMKRIRNEIEGR